MGYVEGSEQAIYCMITIPTLRDRGCLITSASIIL